MSTRARRTIREARIEISELLDFAKSLPDEVGSGRRMSKQENQLRQVVVALVAALQLYLSELLEERGDPPTFPPLEYVPLSPLGSRLSRYWSKPANASRTPTRESETPTANLLRIPGCASWYFFAHSRKSEFVTP